MLNGNLFMALFLLHAGVLRREESRDHAFGDCEVYIMLGENEVGVGYFGGGFKDLAVFGFDFPDDMTYDIREKIPVGSIGRNDSTGPDKFVLGQTMPGLTREAVRQELIEF